MNVTYLDPITGGYDLIDNKMVTANATVSKANRLLLQKVGADMANPTYGNPTAGITTQLSPSIIIDGINSALLPLTISSEITLVTIISVSRTILQRWKAEIEITLPSGETLPIFWTQPKN